MTFKPQTPGFIPGCFLFIVIAVSKREEDWRAAEVEGFAQAALEVAFVAPVEETEVAAVNDEPRWAGIGLNHVAKLGMGVFEAGRRMRINCVGK